MDHILSVKHLTKQYQNFLLDDISFSVPYGSIVGLIGENGAGKSTIIKAITDVISKDGGTVHLLGHQHTLPVADKAKLAVVFDGNNFADVLTVKTLNHVFQNIYPNWDEDTYNTMVTKLQLPQDKKIKDFSKGMMTKLSIIVAFSHKAELMILDEATSGLDPVVRDDILDMLLDFVSQEKNAVLVSSHITSDLEKIADYIVFIHKGKLVFSLPKDELMEQYGLLRCGKEDFTGIDQGDIVVYREQDYAVMVLVSNRENIEKKYPHMMVERITIDEIMLMYSKGETI